jgi:hypothetical protein
LKSNQIDIARLITDYVMENYIQPTLEVKLQLAQRIVAVFPTDVAVRIHFTLMYKSIYYIDCICSKFPKDDYCHRVSNSSSKGMLYNCFHSYSKYKRVAIRYGTKRNKKDKQEEGSDGRDTQDDE